MALSQDRIRQMQEALRGQQSPSAQSSPNIQSQQTSTNQGSVGISNPEGLRQRVNQALGNGGNQQDNLAQQILNAEVNETDSPLSFFQNLQLSFIPDDRLRLQFLSEQFPNANISQDKKGDILINNRRVNPRGFDVGDIARNVGNVLPLAGQIAGSVLGGIKGSVLGPAGTAAGLVGGGTAGGVTGKAMQLAIGEMFVDQDAKDVFDALTEEAFVSGSSEVLGLGITSVGGRVISRLGRSKFAKGVGSMLEKAKKNLGLEATVSAMEFAGGIDRSATRILAPNFSKTINAKNLDPSRSVKLANRVFFGDENVKLLQTPIAGTNVTQAGKKLAESIKRVNNTSFDQTVQQFANPSLSTESINIIKKFPINRIIRNSTDDVPLRIAKEISDSAMRQEKVLGKEVGKQVNRALRSVGSQDFDVAPVVRTIQKELSQIDLTKGIKVSGARKTTPPKVRGQEKLNQLVNLFKAPVGKEKARELGVEAGEKVFFGQGIGLPSTRQAVRMKNQFNVLADEIFKDQKIPDAIKRSVQGIAKDFRARVAARTGVTEQNLALMRMKNLIDDVNIDRGNALSSLETQVKNFFTPGGGQAPREGIENLIKFLPEGDKIFGDINTSFAGRELAKIRPLDTISSLEGALTRKTILDETRDNAEEVLLRQLDDSFRMSGNKELRKRAFFRDAQLSVANKQMVQGSPELLRIMALARLTGLGALAGGLIGEERGAVVGGLGALAISDPRVLSRILVKADKFGRGKKLLATKSKRAIRNKLRNIVTEETKGKTQDAGVAALRAITGRSVLNQE